MGKKGRKIREPRLSEAQLHAPTGVGTGVKAGDLSKPVGGSLRISSEEALAQEYHYVLTDLKRIGLLALVMLALLIILAVVVI